MPQQWLIVINNRLRHNGPFKVRGPVKPFYLVLKTSLNATMRKGQKVEEVIVGRYSVTMIECVLLEKITLVFLVF